MNWDLAPVILTNLTLYQQVTNTCISVENYIKMQDKSFDFSQFPVDILMIPYSIYFNNRKLKRNLACTQSTVFIKLGSMNASSVLYLNAEYTCMSL